MPGYTNESAWLQWIKTAEVLKEKGKVIHETYGSVNTNRINVLLNNGLLGHETGWGMNVLSA